MSTDKKSKAKQKKINVRVDFTPMVDMMMLLITFFMLCTTLSKPQTMEISMPSNDKNIKDDDRSQVKASQAITILLDANDKIYYFEGIPNYNDPHFLKETSYGADGIRAILIRKNAFAVQQKKDLDQKKLLRKINDAQYSKMLSDIKSAKQTPTVIIKATDQANYKNLVDALDEMQICSIGKYVIDVMKSSDKQLITNLKNGTAGQPQQ
ncbi:MAG: biopolymer transporter ExbD [Bacteroidaceae bacterium]|jgi:biopolymer transport protein ExbD|nr:biopolymer transporter ExbD [Bacteroidaceae bacterium]